MEFSDVGRVPPKSGRPNNLLSYQEFLEEIEKSYLRRNALEFEWADDADTETDDPPPDE